MDIYGVFTFIMNVKTPNKSCRIRNKYGYPLRVNEEYFSDWLGSWNSISGRNGKLTKESFTALHHTTYAFLELTKYCIEELKMQYILLGKFQTDHLEARFSQYWQLSGDQYNILIQQMFECEKKLECYQILKLSLPYNQKYIKTDF